MNNSFYQKVLLWLNNPGFQKYLKNAGWMFFSRIFSLIISFFVTTYVVRYLGPENYGFLSYSISYIGIFSVFTSLGLDQILYRELIQYPDKKNEYLGTSIILKMVAGIIMIGIAVGSAWHTSHQDISFLLISILSLTFLFNGWNIVAYEFQASVLAKYPSLINLYVSVLLNILKLVVVFMNKGVIYLTIIFMLEPVIYAVFYIFYRNKYYDSVLNWRFNYKIAKSLLYNSLPLLFSSAFAVIYSRIDQVMIKNFIDTKSVGIYDAAARIAEAWYFIPGLVVGSLFPALVNARQTSEYIYYARLKRLGLFMVLISVGVALPVALLGKQIIMLLYGVEFLGAVPILQIYIWAGIGTSLAYLTQNFLLAENNQKAVFIASFSAMAMNVVLNFIFIPKYGIAGAAWATFISYFCNFLSLFLFKDTRGKLLKIIFNS
ncbi:MAG: hypothetical protein RL094_251 [Candidatus Parcubacteria bacterium]|jgi:O-antigen/teichoic acid export membrane protein